MFMGCTEREIEREREREREKKGDVGDKWNLKLEVKKMQTILLSRQLMPTSIGEKVEATFFYENPKRLQ